VQLEQLPLSALEEIRLINDLIAHFNNYDDDLPYACVPEMNPAHYNSSSFARGLLDKAMAHCPCSPCGATLHLAGVCRFRPPSSNPREEGRSLHHGHTPDSERYRDLAVGCPNADSVRRFDAQPRHADRFEKCLCAFPGVQPLCNPHMCSRWARAPHLLVPAGCISDRTCLLYCGVLCPSPSGACCSATFLK
jgi:hypothetical protein